MRTIAEGHEDADTQLVTWLTTREAISEIVDGFNKAFVTDAYGYVISLHIEERGDGVLKLIGQKTDIWAVTEREVTAAVEGMRGYRNVQGESHD